MKRLILFLLLLTGCSVSKIPESDQSLILPSSFDATFDKVVQYCLSNNNGVQFTDKNTGVVISSLRNMKDDVSLIGSSFNEKLSFRINKISDNQTSVFLAISVVGQNGESKMERREYYDRVFKSLSKNNP